MQQEYQNYYYKLVDSYKKRMITILVINMHKELVCKEKREKVQKEYKEYYKALIKKYESKLKASKEKEYLHLKEINK